jgi:hypothetical protein
MKKGLKIAVSALLALSVLAGCGSVKSNETISSGMADATLFDDMKKGEEVTASDVTQIFSDALDKTNGADSITIDTQVAIDLTEDGETSSSKSTTQIKYQPVESSSSDSEETTEAAEESETSEQDADTSEESTSDEDTSSSEKIAYVNVQNDYNGETNEIEGYYEGGYLYYTLEDNKVKEVMDYDSLMYIVSSYSLQFTEDVVDSAYKVSDKDKTKYTIKFDPESMAEMMMNNMAGAGSPLGDDEDMIINDAYIYFEVNADGYMSGFDMELDAKFISSATEDETSAEADTEVSEDTTDEAAEATEAATEEAAQDESADGSTKVESPYKYSVVANFTDINSTKVEAFDDLDSYRDVNDVLEEMQSESESEAEEASEGDESGEATEEETKAGEAQTTAE